MVHKVVVDAATDFEAEEVADTEAEEVADTEAEEVADTEAEEVADTEAEEVAGHIAHRRNLFSQPEFLKQLDGGP